MSACCNVAERPECADVGATGPRDFCVAPPRCHPGVRAQVSRLPGSARDALDRTRPVAFHGDLPALGAAVPLRRLIALLDCGTSGSHRGHLSLLQKGDRTMQHQVVSRAGMACGPARAAQGGEGANAAQRRAGAATSGAAVGPGRQGVPIRDRRRERLAGRPLPRALAAPRLPLHVRARLHGGVSVLLDDRGRVRRLRRPPGEPRRHACGGVAGAAREAAGVQAADGVDVSLGVLARQRLQLRLQRLVHRRSNSARASSNTTTERGGHAMDATPVPEPVAQFAATCGTDAPTYSRDRPGMSAFVLEDGVVYHTYSTYARGLDGLWGMYQWLDRAPKGRNETGIWWRRHDEYEPLPQNAGSCCHAAEARA